MENCSDIRNEILKLMDTAHSWLVISHEKPDGDTLGCGAAIIRLGMRLSKRVMFICPDQCPEKYSFFMNGIGLEVSKCLPSGFPGPGGLIICVDTSTTARSYPQLLERNFPCQVINIDHHVDNELYGDVNWIDPTASATGEMVTSLMEVSPWSIKPDEAEALYVAVVSDNGGFSFESTTLKSHNCAMVLLEMGVSPKKIADELNSNLSANILNLWGRAMMRATVFAGGGGAIYWLTTKDFEETGTTREATENLVNFLLRIKGVKMAALCSELPGEGEPRVRASLRASSPFNAREVANVFGGGGHDRASGCIIRASIDDAVSMLRDEMTRHVAGISANT